MRNAASIPRIVLWAIIAAGVAACDDPAAPHREPTEARPARLHAVVDFEDFDPASDSENQQAKAGVEQWSVSVTADDRRLVTFSGPGRPPADLHVPAAYIDRPGVTGMDVGVGAVRHRDGAIVDGEYVVDSDYVVTPVLNVGLKWRVRLVD